MVKYFKVCRAREEITRLNMEIRRLKTLIHEETIHTNKTIKLLTETDSHLAVELKSRWQLRHAINELHIRRLTSIEQSAMFTGVRGIGTPLGLVSADNDAAHTDTHISDLSDSSLHGSGADDDDLAVEDSALDLEKLTDFVLTITD